MTNVSPRSRIITGPWLYFTVAPAPGPVHSSDRFGYVIRCYTAFSTLILSLIVAIVLTRVCNTMSIPEPDQTRAEQYQ